MSGSWYWKILKQITTSSLTPLLCAVAAAGLFQARSIKNAGLFQSWLGAMILFIIVVGYGNRHPWYQLPLVPIAAALAGVACAFVALKLTSRAVKIGLSLFLAGWFGWLAHNYATSFYRPVAAELRDAGLELKRTTPENSLIIAADNGDPTVFYYAQRKGWHFLEKNGIYDGNPSDSEQVITDLEILRKRGASYLVFTKNTSWWLDYYRAFAQHLAESATLMETTPEFKIYELKSVKALP